MWACARITSTRVVPAISCSTSRRCYTWLGWQAAAWRCYDVTHTAGSTDGFKFQSHASTEYQPNCVRAFRSVKELLSSIAHQHSQRSPTERMLPGRVYWSADFFRAGNTHWESSPLSVIIYIYNSNVFAYVIWSRFGHPYGKDSPTVVSESTWKPEIWC